VPARGGGHLRHLRRRCRGRARVIDKNDKKITRPFLS
jgi:hypothetical protein